MVEPFPGDLSRAPLKPTQPRERVKPGEPFPGDLSRAPLKPVRAEVRCEAGGAFPGDLSRAPLKPAVAADVADAAILSREIYPGPH